MLWSGGLNGRSKRSQDWMEEKERTLWKFVDLSNVVCCECLPNHLNTPPSPTESKVIHIKRANIKVWWKKYWLIPKWVEECRSTGVDGCVVGILYDTGSATHDKPSISADVLNFPTFNIRPIHTVFSVGNILSICFLNLANSTSESILQSFAFNLSFHNVPLTFTPSFHPAVCTYTWVIFAIYYIVTILHIKR